MMKKQAKLLSIFMALVIMVTAFTTQPLSVGSTSMTTVSAAKKASVTKILSLYKNRKYSKVKKMCKKLPQNASEDCVKNMSKKMKKAYLKKVKTYKKYSEDSSGEHILDYYLTDVTNNGKAELIIRHGYGDIATSSCTIYKYKKGKAIKLDTILTAHTNLYAYPNHAGVIGLQTTMGYEAVEKYSIKKSKVKTKKYGSREYISRNEDYICLPYRLESHVPFGKQDVSYEALQ